MEAMDNQFKKKISLKEFEVANTSSLNVAADTYGQKAFSVKEASENFQINVVLLTKTDIEFDLIGYDPAIANALRRILLSDLPSMAIEKVHIYQNTSIMQDEVLAHRLGLLPLTADPRLFSYPSQDWTPESGSEKETLQFSLNVKCNSSNDPNIQYENHHVLTKHLKWVPRGDQEKWISTVDPGCKAKDILINKMRPGHEMVVEMFAVKGTGRDHAKFSPVATAFYRLMPSIMIKKPVMGDAALRLQKCFSPGVINIKIGSGGEQEAEIVNERIDSCSRNVFRHDDLKDCVLLDKIRDHFIFTVESVGASAPQDLVCMAWDVIIEKCDYFLEELTNSENS